MTVRTVRSSHSALLFVLVGVIALAAVGCGDSTTNTTVVGDTTAADGDDTLTAADTTPLDTHSADTTAADTQPVDTSVGQDTNLADTASDIGPECTVKDDCPGGVCLGGACCEAAKECAGACCGDTETCFASACIVVGDACASTADCAANQYCEPALGTPPPDPTPNPGQVCLGAAPAPGRCVTLPPPCAGTEPAPGEDCIPVCEFHPAVGRLNAVEQWSWGLDKVNEYPTKIDVWSTPAVGRLTDTNCDGAVNDFDPPNIVFVSGDSMGTCCSCGGNTTSCKTGVLRVLDGLSGDELWSRDAAEAGSMGFAGVSVAIGDLDHDGHMEIAAVTGEGKLALLDHEGNVLAVSADLIDPGWMAEAATGWGGALTIADMDRDGSPEIAYGRVVFTTAVDAAGAWSVTLVFRGAGGWGRARSSAISFFGNLDADPELELLAGRTLYNPDGTVVWNRTDLPEGYSAVADFDMNGTPDVVHIANGRAYLLNGADGTDIMPSIAGPGATPGNGGPPTIADFNGDLAPEIGVAYREYYQVIKPNFVSGALEQVWATQNHDLSSSVTGSTVFDFEGDGASEVIYNDECFLWVYDGRDGSVRFAGLTSSFTATEASLVADVDGDGGAEMVMVANSASPAGWGCTTAQWTTPQLDTTAAGPCTTDADCTVAQACSAGSCYEVIRPGWVGSDGGAAAYRGIKVFRDAENSWVGTRRLWNQHAYNVSNICGDGVCGPTASYGDIPAVRTENWKTYYLNNFRQNIQGDGIFDAPDATLLPMGVACTTDAFTLRAFVRNLGAAVLPAGVMVGFYVVESAGGERLLGVASTPAALFPGQVAEVVFEADLATLSLSINDAFFTRIEIDPAARTFRECKEDNNQSDTMAAYDRCFFN